VVLRGKKPAMAVWLLVGLLLAPVGLVNLVTWNGVAWVRWAFTITFLIGAALVFSSAQRMFQTVAVFSDRLVWKRFASEVVLPYADIRGVEHVVRSVEYESFHEVRITLTNGHIHTISHLADGNDLVRALNTYGARLG
jgi:hypothetical protein